MSAWRGGLPQCCARDDRLAAEYAEVHSNVVKQFVRVRN